MMFCVVEHSENHIRFQLHNTCNGRAQETTWYANETMPLPERRLNVSREQQFQAAVQYVGVSPIGAQAWIDGLMGRREPQWTAVQAQTALFAAIRKTAKEGQK